MQQSVRGVLAAMGCVLLALGGMSVRAADPSTPAVVTAQPPLEAVPATPGAHAQQSRFRRCAAAARSKHLTGAARDGYVRSCTAQPSTAKPTAAAKPAR